MNEPAPQRLKRLDRLAVLLDESIRIPGIGYRIGYDALIGLIPGIGDVAGLAIGTYVVFEAARFRLPASTILRMVTNVALEALIGLIPVAGDVFDATYKANLRNIRLLHKRLEVPDRRPVDDKRYFVGLLLIPIVLGIVLLALVIWLLVAIF